MFRIPYKWSRRPWSNISFMWYDLTHGIANVIRWIPVIWHDEDYDWAYLARIMEYKLRRMSKDTKNWHVVGAEKDGREMLVCAELLRRLQRGWMGYWTNAEKRFGESFEKAKYIGKLAEEQEREDKALLGRIIGRHLNHWWD
jgi:hypothetical protein